MAKHCTVCKQSYPDDQNFCPHCGAAFKKQGAGEVLEALERHNEGVIVQPSEPEEDYGDRPMSGSHSDMDIPKVSSSDLDSDPDPVLPDLPGAAPRVKSEVNLKLPDGPAAVFGSVTEVNLNLPNLIQKSMSDSHSEVDLQLPDVPAAGVKGFTEVNIHSPGDQEKIKSGSHSEVDLQRSEEPRELPKGVSPSFSEVDLQLPEVLSQRSQLGSDSDLVSPPMEAPGGRAVSTQSGVDFDVPRPSMGSGSGSDVTLGQEGPVSGASLVPWADLVDQMEASKKKLSSEPAFDSPSDEDLLRFIREQGPAKEMPPTQGLKPPAPDAPGDESSAVDLAGSRPKPEAPSSGLHLVGEAFDESGFSGVILSGARREQPGPVAGAKPPPAKKVMPPSPPGEAHSGLDLATLSQEPEDSLLHSGGAQGGDSQIIENDIENDSGVDLGARPSGRDLIAEAVESGVDLLGQMQKEAGPEGHEVHRDESHPSSGGDSEVDLGTSDPGEQAELKPPKVRSDPSGYDQNLIRSGPELALDHGSELELNLDAFDEDADGPLSDEAKVARGKGKLPAAEVAKKETVKPPATVLGPPRSGRGILVGGLAGTLAGIGICLAIWIGGIEPPNSWRLGGSAKSPSTNTGASNPDVALREKNDQLAKDLDLAKNQTADLEAAKQDSDKARDTALLDKKALSDKIQKTEDLRKKAEEHLKTAEDLHQAAETKATDLAKEVKTLATAREEADSKLLAAMKKLKTADDKAGDLSKEIKELTAAHADVDAKLKDADAKLKSADAKVKVADDKLKTADATATGLAKEVKDLTTARVDAETRLTDFAKKLVEAKMVGPNPKPADILKGLDRLVTTAKTNDPQGQLAAAKLEVQHAQEALKESHPPKEMLAIWLPLLSDRVDKSGADRALTDVALILKDPAAKPAVKAEALAVKGLALRNQGQFDEARTTLEQALKTGGADATTASWYESTRTALKELTEPAAYFLPRAEQLQSSGRHGEALEVLHQGVKVFPKDAGLLLARRALVRLEIALEKAKGSLQPGDAAVTEARKDADAAITAGAVAEGHYAAGRIAEELGQLTDARQGYQQALQAKSDNVYRLALARILLKMHQEKSGSEGRSSETIPLGAGIAKANSRSAPLLNALLLLVDLANQDPAASLERQEADKLADEILATAKNDPQGLLQKAQAYAIKGLWAKALTTYVEGLRPRLRREEMEGLLAIIANQPTAKRPDTLAVPNQDRAEEHYAAGLRLYSHRNFAEAEKELVSAVENFNQDARYYYYLGLSRLMQDKRTEAGEDFELAVKLERMNRPDRDAVSLALERIQGPPRLELNKFRH